VTIFESDIFAVANGTEKNPCYLCARMRRGALYAKAQELGCSKIALGHHKNDVIETTVLAMFYGAQLQGMMPKLHSTNFPGMELIRPLYCVREDDIIAWAQHNGLEFLQCACRFTERTATQGRESESKRKEIKRLIRDLSETNPDLENNIFRAIHSVSLDTFPIWKTRGETHSFLEEYSVTDPEN
jgi:tRNA(Ile)-lysidine synthase TilS/MesJ